MRLVVSDSQLFLIDKVLGWGHLGKTREDVLNAAVIEHARYIAAGGTPFDLADPGAVEVDAPTYGPLRREFVLQPVTGKAIPVLAGEVLRLVQVEGGTCVDFNAYNLHDYKEHLDCGFTRIRGVATGRGAIAWTGSPRARPMFTIADHSDRFHQYFQGHRCNGVMNELEYGFVGHPNCQDTLAEAIREYGLTPDDTHDSYNLWMHAEVTPEGKRQFHWNRARKDDYVDLLAFFDTLAVPAICGGDISPLNNFDPRPIKAQVFAASRSTRALVAFVNERFASLRAQIKAEDFKQRDILASRALRPDPTYVPSYLPVSRKTAIEVNLTPDADCHIETFLATGNYLQRKEDAVLHAFFRWLEANWQRDRVATKLRFRAPTA